MTQVTDKEFNWVVETTGMMPIRDLEWIIEQAAKVNSWTEVGTYAGRSALAVGLSLPSGSLLQLVDIKFHVKLWINLSWLLERRPELKIIVCQCPSLEASELLVDTDVVFIDDNHQYEGVRTSLLSWKDKCKILCGHDYDRSIPPYPPHAGVKRAVDEVCSSKAPVHEDSGLWIRTN